APEAGARRRRSRDGRQPGARSLLAARGDAILLRRRHPPDRRRDLRGRPRRRGHPRTGARRRRMTDTPTVPGTIAPAAATPAPPHPEHGELDPRRWIALASVMTALFMVLLDISIVNVAIPAIRNNLSANNADIQFVVAGYGLAYAVMLITGGRLGDIYGRKRV